MMLLNVTDSDVQIWNLDFTNSYLTKSSGIMHDILRPSNSKVDKKRTAI